MYGHGLEAIIDHIDDINVTAKAGDGALLPHGFEEVIMEESMAMPYL